jgi:hypothetical protein
VHRDSYLKKTAAASAIAANYGKKTTVGTPIKLHARSDN